MPDEPRVEKYDLSKDPAWIEFGKTVKGIVTIMQQQGAAVSQLRADFAASKTAPKGGKKDDDGEPDGDNEPDLDNLSQSDFAKFLMKQVGGILDTKLKAVTDKVDGSVRNVTNTELRRQVEEFRKDHKDFNDWTDEMTTLSKENPTLSIGRLYQLARSENPDKVKTVDAKYVDKKDDVKGKDEGLTLFGGFKPSTKTSGEGSKEGKDEKMTVDQAAEKAWDEAVIATPALASFSGDVLD